MESTLIHGLKPNDIQLMIEKAIENKLKPKPEIRYIPKLAAAKRLKRTVQTLDSWHRAGKLKKVYLGGRVFYKEEDLKLFDRNI